MDRTEQTKEIVCRLLKENKIINNHNDKEEQIDGVVITDQGYVCPIFLNTTFCLNGLYIDSDTNKIHLSCSSVGGTFRGRDVLDSEVVRTYNEEVGRRLISGRIERVLIMYNN